MDGVLLVNKPAGITSHDVVAAVRRATRVKRVGHTGTLDPMATGLLLVCIGKATRIAEYLTGLRKTYVAGVTLGIATDTQDSTGETISTVDASEVTEGKFREVCGGFVGAIKQVPPMVSALKRDGKPLYWYARKGKTLEREAREINIYRIDFIAFEAGRQAEARIAVECSSGTYIRTLCADIGERLGCGGLMSSLVRTRIGDLNLENAVSLDDVKGLADSGCLTDRLVSLNVALESMQALTLGSADTSRFCNGIAIPMDSPLPQGSVVRVLDESGNLLAIAEVRNVEDTYLLAPHKVLAESPEVTAE